MKKQKIRCTSPTCPGKKVKTKTPRKCTPQCQSRQNEAQTEMCCSSSKCPKKLIGNKKNEQKQPDEQPGKSTDQMPFNNVGKCGHEACAALAQAQNYPAQSQEALQSNFTQDTRPTPQPYTQAILCGYGTCPVDKMSYQQQQEMCGPTSCQMDRTPTQQQQQPFAYQQQLANSMPNQLPVQQQYPYQQQFSNPAYSYQQQLQNSPVMCGSCPANRRPPEQPYLYQQMQNTLQLNQCGQVCPLESRPPQEQSHPNAQQFKNSRPHSMEKLPMQQSQLQNPYPMDKCCGSPTQYSMDRMPIPQSQLSPICCSASQNYPMTGVQSQPSQQATNNFTSVDRIQSQQSACCCNQQNYYEAALPSQKSLNNCKDNVTQSSFDQFNDSSNDNTEEEILSSGNKSKNLKIRKGDCNINTCPIRQAARLSWRDTSSAPCQASESRQGNLGRSKSQVLCNINQKTQKTCCMGNACPAYIELKNLREMNAKPPNNFYENSCCTSNACPTNTELRNQREMNSRPPINSYENSCCSSNACPANTELRNQRDMNAKPPINSYENSCCSSNACPANTELRNQRDMNAKPPIYCNQHGCFVNEQVNYEKSAQKVASQMIDNEHAAAKSVHNCSDNCPHKQMISQETILGFVSQSSTEFETADECCDGCAKDTKEYETLSSEESQMYCNNKTCPSQKPKQRANSPTTRGYYESAMGTKRNCNDQCCTTNKSPPRVPAKMCCTTQQSVNKYTDNQKSSFRKCQECNARFKYSAPEQNNNEDEELNENQTLKSQSTICDIDRCSMGRTASPQNNERAESCCIQEGCPNYENRRKRSPQRTCNDGTCSAKRIDTIQSNNFEREKPMKSCCQYEECPMYKDFKNQKTISQENASSNNAFNQQAMSQENPYNENQSEFRQETEKNELEGNNGNQEDYSKYSQQTITPSGIADSPQNPNSEKNELEGNDGNQEDYSKYSQQTITPTGIADSPQNANSGEEYLAGTFKQETEVNELEGNDGKQEDYSKYSQQTITNDNPSGIADSPQNENTGEEYLAGKFIQETEKNEVEGNDGNQEDYSKYSQQAITRENSTNDNPSGIADSPHNRNSKEEYLGGGCCDQRTISQVITCNDNTCTLRKAPSTQNRNYEEANKESCCNKGKFPPHNQQTRSQEKHFNDQPFRPPNICGSYKPFENSKAFEQNNLGISCSNQQSKQFSPVRNEYKCPGGRAVSPSNRNFEEGNQGKSCFEKGSRYNQQSIHNIHQCSSQHVKPKPENRCNDNTCSITPRTNQQDLDFQQENSYPCNNEALSNHASSQRIQCKTSEIAKAKQTCADNTFSMTNSNRNIQPLQTTMTCCEMKDCPLYNRLENEKNLKSAETQTSNNCFYTSMTVPNAGPICNESVCVSIKRVNIMNCNQGQNVHTMSNKGSCPQNNDIKAKQIQEVNSAQKCVETCSAKQPTIQQSLYGFSQQSIQPSGELLLSIQREEKSNETYTNLNGETKYATKQPSKLKFSQQSVQPSREQLLSIQREEESNEAYTNLNGETKYAAKQPSKLKFSQQSVHPSAEQLRSASKLKTADCCPQPPIQSSAQRLIESDRTPKPLPQQQAEQIAQQILQEFKLQQARRLYMETEERKSKCPSDCPTSTSQMFAPKPIENFEKVKGPSCSHQTYERREQCCGQHYINPQTHVHIQPPPPPPPPPPGTARTTSCCVIS